MLPTPSPQNGPQNIQHIYRHRARSDTSVDREVGAWLSGLLIPGRTVPAAMDRLCSDLAVDLSPCRSSATTDRPAGRCVLGGLELSLPFAPSAAFAISLARSHRSSGRSGTVFSGLGPPSLVAPSRSVDLLTLVMYHGLMKYYIPGYHGNPYICIHHTRYRIGPENYRSCYTTSVQLPCRASDEKVPLSIEPEN